MKSKVVFLWCHPRSISTAFARAFMQRQDFVTLHEPFTAPFIFGPERLSDLFNDEIYARYTDATFDHVVQQIITESKTEKRVFVKDMAFYIIRPDYKSHPENPTMLPLDFLLSAQHTFLIRTPEKTVPSEYHAMTKGNYSLTYDAYLKEYSPVFNGYPEVQILFDFLTELTGRHPSLVDAADLLQEPQGVLTKYCEAIEDHFEPQMLEWKAGKIEALQNRTGFHDNAEQSTGFNEITRKKDDDDDNSLPEIVQQTIKEIMPIYQKLAQYKM